MSGPGAIVGILAVGLVAGVLGGMFGIGGGLVIVPALMFLFGVHIKTATGTSMFAQIWPIGLLGVLAYWQRKEVIPWAGLLIALGYFFGAFFGAKFVGMLSEVAMKRLYAVFLLVMGVYLFSTADKKRAVPQPLPEPPAAPAETSR